MSEEDFEFDVGPTQVVQGMWVAKQRYELLKAAERVADAALLWREYAGIQPQDMSVTMARRRAEMDLIGAVDAYKKEKDNA